MQQQGIKRACSPQGRVSLPEMREQERASVTCLRPEVASLISPCVAGTRTCGLRDLTCPGRHPPPSVSVLVTWQFSHLLSRGKAAVHIAAEAVYPTSSCGNATLVWLQVAHGIATVEEGTKMVLISRVFCGLGITKFRKTTSRVGLIWSEAVICLVFFPDASKLCATLATAWIMKHAVRGGPRQKTTIREATTRGCGTVHAILLAIPRNCVSGVLLHPCRTPFITAVRTVRRSP